MQNNEKKLINKYATVVYLYYTRENRVTDVRDYPDYIAYEVGLGFSVPFIKKLFKTGLIAKGEDGFVVTDKGTKYLEDNWSFVHFFNLACPYISVFDFSEVLSKANEQSTFEDMALDLLKDKCAQYRGKRNYLAVENLNMELAQMYYYLEEYQKALYHYLTSLYYSISGVKEYVHVRNYKNGKITQKELVAKYNDYIYVNPEIIAKVREMSKLYYPEMADEIVTEAKLGFSLCSKERIAEAYDLMSRGRFTNSGWQSQTTELFKKKMGFVVDKPAEPSPVDANKIISQEDAQNEGLESVAKLAEIAEKESKK